MAPKSKENPKTSTPAIEDLFTSLHQHIKDTKYEEAVKVADQGFHNSHLPSYSLILVWWKFESVISFTVLSIVPTDEDAIRCKVVALIKDDKFDDYLIKDVKINGALSVINSFQKLPIDLGFHKVL